MILYGGDNTFESYHTARAEAVKQSTKLGSELVIIDADEMNDLQELSKYLDGQDLFNNSPVILAKRMLKNSSAAKQLLTRTDLLENPSLFLWEDGKVDERLSLVKSLKESKQIVSFELPKNYLVPNWIIAQAKKYQLIIGKPAAELFAEVTDYNLWVIDNELQKLVAYLYNQPKKVITIELINTIVTNQHTGDIWKFLDSLTLEDKSVMLSQLNKLLRNSTDAHYLIAMLCRELRIVAQVKYASEHNLKSNLNPFVVKKTLAKANHFTWQSLKRLYIDLLKLDTGVRNGEMDENSALTLYLLNF